MKKLRDDMLFIICGIIFIFLLMPLILLLFQFSLLHFSSPVPV